MCKHDLTVGHNRALVTAAKTMFQPISGKWCFAAAMLLLVTGTHATMLRQYAAGDTQQAESRSMRQHSQFSAQGSRLLKLIEQLRLRPYDDQTGRDISNWVRGATIGYGHLIHEPYWPRYKGGIDEPAADTLFDSDHEPFLNVVRTHVTAQLSSNQFDALVIFVYNIGSVAFAKSDVLKLVNDPTAKTRHKDLESAWKAWDKSQGVVNQGLVHRRNAEWRIYSENIYQRW